MRLTSRQHEIVKRARAIRAGRGAHGEVLLDGDHLLTAALAAGVPVRAVLATSHTSLVGRAASAGAQIYEAAAAVMDAVSPVRTPSGIVAIAEWTPARAESMLSGASPLLIGLVDVQDPGNVGSVIRSADALGATGVLALGSTADPAGWKALRGAMGSTFRIAVGRDATDTALHSARAHGIRIVATMPSGGAPAMSDGRGGRLILLGGEGPGLGAGIVAKADERISIPMRAGVESLNIAVVAALVLQDLRRAQTPAKAGAMP